jgi:hypothetical protein
MQMYVLVGVLSIVTGALILVVPKFFQYFVAIYLILVGVLTLVR